MQGLLPEGARVPGARNEGDTVIQVTAEVVKAANESLALRELLQRCAPDALRAYDEGAGLPERGWYTTNVLGKRHHWWREDEPAGLAPAKETP